MLAFNAILQTAVLLVPVVLSSRHCSPTAVLLLAVVFNFKESLPTATFEAPVVFENNAF